MIRTKRNEIRLTQAQEGIWFGQNLSPNPALYNTAELLEIRGSFDLAVFEQALKEVYLQAETLHFIYSEVNDAPQMVFCQQEINLKVVDLRQQKADLNTVKIRARKDLGLTIDLSKDAVFRNSLFCLSDTHFVWYQCIHHIACDGYAYALLSQTVVERYNSLIENRGVRQIAPFGRLSKIVEEDSLYLKSAKYELNRDFWLAYLPKNYTPASFSLRSSDSVDFTESISLKHSRRFSTDLLIGLKQLASALHATWPEVLIAAVAACLAQRCAASEIVLGLPVMGRIGSASARVPAMVMNIIPLRLNILKAQTFSGLVKQVKKQILLTRPHAKYRYEQMRRDLKLATSKGKLFGPVVNIMPFDRPLHFNGAALTQHGVSSGPVEDISLGFVLAGSQEVRFDIEANPKLYTEDEVQLLSRDFERDLNAFLETPDRQVKVDEKQFSILRGEIYKAQENDVLDALEQCAKSQPQKIAIEYGVDNITYTELLLTVKVLAEKFSELGKSIAVDGLNTVIAISMDRGLPAVISCLAALEAGAAWLFIDKYGPDIRNKQILDEVPAKLLICDDLKACIEDVPQIRVDVISLLDQCKDIVCKKLEQGKGQFLFTDFLRRPDPEELAYFVYTSGSTGKPKGVPITHRAMWAFVSAAMRAYPIEKRDRVLQFAPLHFDTYVEEVFCSLCSGASLHMRAEEDIQSVSGFLASCANKEISVLDLPTAYWHEMVFACYRQNIELPECIKILIIGGEAALPERVQQWHKINKNNIRLLNTYGPSEASVVASFAELKPASTLSIGKPLENRVLAVVDENMQVLTRGAKGELVIGGEGLANSYHLLEKQSLEKFCPVNSLIFKAEDRVYRTGDRVLIDGEGDIHFLGRIDEELKISGQRIQPMEIENVLCQLEEVLQAAVCVRLNAKGEKYLYAFVVSKVSKDIIRNKLKSYLPSAMIPQNIRLIERLPLNSSGKVDRKKLSASIEIEQEPVVATKEGNGRGETAGIVLSILRKTLNVQEIDARDDFFMLGGYSLQAIQLVNRLNSQFDIMASTDLVFRFPAINELINEIEKLRVLGGQYPPGIQASERNVEFSHRRKIQMLKDSHLAEKDFPYYKNQVSRKAAKLILLTGGSGFVGVQILDQLIKSTQATIVCLVRARDEESAETKIIEAMQEQSISIPGWKNRVAIALGDIEQEMLGLSEKLFAGLANSCDLIIHNAAKVSVMQDYPSLKAANLDSTRRLLYLATQSWKKGISQEIIPLHFVSTVACCLDPEVGEIAEGFVDWHKGLMDGYQQSKWAAENLLRQASERNYPVSIYRLARVSGDLSTGFVNKNDLMWNIIRASVNNRACPKIDFAEPWTPVDEVAKNLVQGVLNQDAERAVHHLLPKQLLTSAEIFRWISVGRRNLKPLAMNDWLDLLEAGDDPEDHILASFFRQNRDTKSNGLPKFSAPRRDPEFTNIGKQEFLKYYKYWEGLLKENCTSELKDETTYGQAS